MTQKNQPNRIAAEDVGDFRSWRLPLIDDNGTVLSTAEKEAKERAAEEQRRAGESVEDVDMPERASHSGMTAADMQEIFDAAEKDGFAQGHKEGSEKGLAEGYEAGRQQGLMEMRQQLVAEQQRFQKLAQALLQPLAEQDDDIEIMLVDAICTLTQSVVQRELTIDSSQIVELVRAAVEALPIGHKNLRVYLNPDDLAAVETYAQEQQLEWSFRGDEKLAAGGCRIETDESRVDFSVAQRLQGVLEQFVTRQLADGSDDDDATSFASQRPNPSQSQSPAQHQNTNSNVRQSSAPEPDTQNAFAQNANQDYSQNFNQNPNQNPNQNSGNADSPTQPQRPAYDYSGNDGNNVNQPPLTHDNGFTDPPAQPDFNQNNQAPFPNDNYRNE